MAIRFDGNAADDLTVAITFSADVGTLMAWVQIVTDRNDFSTFFETRAASGSDGVVVQTNVKGY